MTGDVREIGLFVTTLDTVDNLRVTVGNGKILSDNVVNYTHNPYRRVDLKCQIANGVDPRDAMARLEVMVSMSGFEIPIRALRQQISSAINIVVQANRLTGGIRLSAFRRLASTTSARVSSRRLIRWTLNAGSHVPSASMKPSNSPAATWNPALIAAP